MNNKTRLNKYLAVEGYASRREADALIEAGEVFINGIQAQLGDYVVDGDEVVVQRKQPVSKTYYAYYKPVGVVTVNAQKDEEEIKDIVTFPTEVHPVGRLDKDSEGLIIFTNDGRLTYILLSPESAFEKEYAVSVNKAITHQFLTHMQRGVDIGAVGEVRHYTTKKAKVRRTTPTSFDIVLTEGKNRQIRRMCSALGYKVTKLKRFRIGSIELGSQKRGMYRKLQGKELSEFLVMLDIDKL